MKFLEMRCNNRQKQTPFPLQEVAKFDEKLERESLIKIRVGGESASSVAKRKLGLNRQRRRGREKVTLSIFLAATALNILRMHNWLVWCLFSLQFSKISGFLVFSKA